MATKETKAATSSRKCPADYVPQQGSKAILTLADFEDSQLFAELRRRGFNGELRLTKVVTV